MHSTKLIMTIVENNIMKGPEPIEPIIEESLGSLFYRTLQNIGNRQINGLTGEEITYKQLLTQTCRIASALKHYGIRQNDVIATLSENSLYFLQPLIAAIYFGAITALLSVFSTPKELLHSVSISKPKIIFCSRENVNKILAIKTRATYIQKIIILDQKENLLDIESLEEFINNNVKGNIDPNNFTPLKKIDIQHQVAVIMSSSGTTGLSKGVMITHKNLLYAMYSLNDPRISYKQLNAVAIIPLPMFHSFGLILGLSSLISQNNSIILPRFEEHVYLHNIQKHKVSSIVMIPTMAALLARSPLIEKFNLSSVKDAIIGGRPLSNKIAQTMQKRLNVSTVRQLFGMTEGSTALLMTPLNETNPVDSVGKVIPLVDATVIDPETNQNLGPGKCGEICFKSVVVMKGYLNNDAATNATIDKNGWLHSGDYGYYDENRSFYVISRLKELIKYKGFQVAPAEIEQLLLAHPHIQEAAVVGRPDELAGELPTAFIVKKTNSELTEEEVQNIVSGQLSYYKRLRGGVIFVDNIPKTWFGKIKRMKLQELLQVKTSKPLFNAHI